MAVQLARSLRVSTPKGVQVGPLMADDRGVYVQAGRKMFTRSHPGRYDIFRWADVTGYRLGAARGVMLGGSTVNANHTQIEFRTATNVHSWNLPYNQTVITARIGTWLAQIDANQAI